MSRSTGRESVAGRKRNRAPKGDRIHAPSKRLKGQIAQKIDTTDKSGAGRKKKGRGERS